MLTIKNFFIEIMEHKEIDHNAAHLTWGNQFLHFISSIMMIYVYYMLWCWYNCRVCYVCNVCDYNITIASLVTISAQTLRQGGHFFIEGNATHKELLKIGYTTDMKKKAICGFIPTIYSCWYVFPNYFYNINGYQLSMLIYASIIMYRVIWLSMHGDHILQGLVWWCKIFSDVFTDIHLYGPTIWGETAPKMYVWTVPELEFYNKID